MPAEVKQPPGIAPGGASTVRLGKLYRSLLAAVSPVTLVSLVPDGGPPHAMTFDKPGPQMAAWIKAEQTAGRNIYLQLNTGERRNAKLSKASITRLNGFVADVDAKDGRSLEEAWETVAALPLKPTIVTMTGGGYQPIYLFEHPLPARPAMVARVESLGEALATQLDGDPVQNVDRICRLPLTLNFPSEKKRKQGRTVAMARVAGGSGRRYAPEALEAALGVVPAAHAAEPDDGAGRLGWFGDLAPEQRDAALEAMLKCDPVLALADKAESQRDGPSWWTVLAACARSGAPNAEALCRAWAMTSPRYSGAAFDARFKSFGTKP